MVKTAKIQHFAAEEGSSARAPVFTMSLKAGSAHGNWGSCSAEEKKKAGKKKEKHTKLELLITSLCC